MRKLEVLGGAAVLGAFFPAPAVDIVMLRLIFSFCYLTLSRDNISVREQL